MIFVEEALQTLLNNHDNPQHNTEDPVRGVVNSTGKRKYEIPRETLSMLIYDGIKVKQIAELLNVSKRTVERRMHEHELTIRQTYSQISDEELVHEVSKLCHEHPNVGYRTIQSLLQTKGLRIQEYRVRKCVRDCDPCGVLLRRVFLSTSRVCRRTYSVSGPQALWHIDGNHKLIRWRLVIHGGIDGYSRLPVFLKVNNNNHADTVLHAFVEAVHKFGLPQRVRSDKGGENVKVAEFMLQHQTGVQRPFIAGRSVHNQRIERLWREIWTGCTSLYYSLFYNMEDEGILDVSSELHIMLLHLVFLPRIQSHLDRFAEALRRRPLRTENSNTPLQLWLTGPRNDSSVHEQGNMDAYGIDFEQDQVSVHPESVIVPEGTPFPEEVLQQIQHILDKESDCFATDVYREALEYIYRINLDL
ncbi:uncharacterized protein LOC128550671 isoform X2 [Mercenaria mercenaria]|nr:uncharacterized protein LOC128550671 isoform X2 [Mercenaria mercenaria]XP_053386143.1 uncharacterized protein LOC128550671 isoform X2 [Mercenaria mercenaria]